MISCTKSELPPVGKDNYIQLIVTSNINSIKQSSKTNSILYINSNGSKKSLKIVFIGYAWTIGISTFFPLLNVPISVCYTVRIFTIRKDLGIFQTIKSICLTKIYH